MHYILLKTGERVTIRLDPPKPGYNWYYTISEDWVISMIEPYGYPFKSGSLEAQHGAVQEQKIFEVTGLKPGKVTIRFYQMDPAREADPPSEETNYTVEVKTF